MTENYHGWLISVYRIGSFGQYTADARDTNNALPDIAVTRYDGSGAKRRALQAIKTKIDRICPVKEAT